MGFAWSSYVAQSVMVGCCMAAGSSSDDFLADECRVPDAMTDVIGVATDDVMHFTNTGPYRGQIWTEHLEDAFGKAGVISNVSKKCG